MARQVNFTCKFMRASVHHSANTGNTERRQGGGRFVLDDVCHRRTPAELPHTYRRKRCPRWVERLLSAVERLENQLVEVWSGWAMPFRSSI